MRLDRNTDRLLFPCKNWWPNETSISFALVGDWSAKNAHEQKYGEQPLHGDVCVSLQESCFLSVDAVVPSVALEFFMHLL